MEPSAHLTLARFSDHESGHWLESALKILSNVERERVAATPDPIARTQHGVGRALIRLLAADAGNLEPKLVEVAVTATGKPVLPQFPMLHVSVAHTPGLVLLGACASAAIGVDVEPARSTTADPRRLAGRLFHGSEVSALSDVPDDEVREWFSRIWTIKEAVGKALGDGIGPSLSGTVVECGQAGFALASVADGQPASSWTLHQTIAPGGTEKIAVAIRAPAVMLDSIQQISLGSFSEACLACASARRQAAG